MISIILNGDGNILGSDLFTWLHIQPYFIGYCIFTLSCIKFYENKNVYSNYVYIGFVFAGLCNEIYIASAFIFLLMNYKFIKNNLKYYKYMLYFILIRIIISFNKFSYDLTPLPNINIRDTHDLFDYINYICNVILIKNISNQLLIAIIASLIVNFSLKKQNITFKHVNIFYQKNISNDIYNVLLFSSISLFIGMSSILFYGRFYIGGNVANYYFPLYYFCFTIISIKLIQIVASNYIKKIIFISGAFIYLLTFQDSIKIVDIKIFRNKIQTALIVPGIPLSKNLENYPQKLNDCPYSIINDFSGYDLHSIVNLNLGNKDPYSGVFLNYKNIIPVRIATLFYREHDLCLKNKILINDIKKDLNYFLFDNTEHDGNVKFLDAQNKITLDYYNFNDRTYNETSWYILEKYLKNVFIKSNEIVSDNDHDNVIKIQANDLLLFNSIININLDNNLILVIDLSKRDYFIYLFDLTSSNKSEVLASGVLVNRNYTTIKISSLDSDLIMIDNLPILKLKNLKASKVRQYWIKNN